jgi:GDP-6-deoxy-D-talose 4-dehydrogenase
MTRTLITGAGGFTGRYVAALLAERGHVVHGIVHTPEVQPIDGVHQVHVADLCDFASIERIAKDVQPDHVVHLAGIAFVAHADIEQIYRANVVGTRQLLQALTQLRLAPRSVLIASSANIYGNAREEILDENMSFAPANDYGVSKVATEMVASLYRDRLPLIVARPFNYTGRGQSSNFIIPKIIEHARRRASVIELGNLDVARDFSDVRAVAEIYGRLLAEPQAVGGTYNVCSGRAVALREIIELTSSLSGHCFEVRVNPAFVRANEVRTLRGSPTRLEQVLGAIPSIPIEDTLRWMLED